MSQDEISASTEDSEEDEFIAVWPWSDLEQSESDGSGRDQDRVLLARSQVSWVEISGHLIELYTVTGEKYMLRGCGCRKPHPCAVTCNFPGPTEDRRTGSREDHPLCSCDCPTSPSPA
jgi:hypothetical protein